MQGIIGVFELIPDRSQRSWLHWHDGKIFDRSKLVPCKNIRGDLCQYSVSNSIMKNLQFLVPSSEPKLDQQNRNYEVKTEIDPTEPKLTSQNRIELIEQKLQSQNRN